MFLASIVPTTASAQDGSEVDALQAMIAEWTEVRRVIGEERADWKVEKVHLQETLEILEKQVETINEKLEETEGVGDETLVELDRLEGRRDALMASNNAVRDSLGALEAAVQRLVVRFPPPLIDTVEPLLRRIPEDPNNTDMPVSQRLQNVVAVVSLAERFNTTLVKRGEVLEIAGQEKQVWTLYWGLAASFSVDAEATSALIGYPGDNGWVYEEQPLQAESIARLVATYDGVDVPAFIEIPVSLR